MENEDPTYFGDGENPADVPAGKLESGVWIDGYPINQDVQTMLVQEVSREGARVGIDAVNMSTGMHHCAVLPAGRLVTTYGQI